MIKYEHFDALPQLIADRVITARPHPSLPLKVYNYTVAAQMTPIAEWTQPMKDCRGLILDNDGYVVGRPFQKFWNLSQCLNELDPSEAFTVFEKLDGSLGLVTSYAGERVVATRGSFESEQAEWFRRWLDAKHPNFMPSGETWLLEIVFPGNRIVVDYGKRSEGVLLAVMAPDGTELTHQFWDTSRFTRAREFNGIVDFTAINTDPRFAGEEGFVIRTESGKRFKVKLDEYCRLHKLIQCSTRTIWELLRSGSGIQELVDRVPAEFAEWVRSQSNELKFRQSNLEDESRDVFATRNPDWTRKEYAEWAKTYTHPSILFALLDGKPIGDMCWKIVEPKWSLPFKKESEDE